MELLYLYLKKYGKIKEKEFCFNPRYKFSRVNQEEQTVIHLHEDKGFFNVFNDYNENIKNATVIVGENGTGKTTLMQFLMEFIRYQGIFPNENQYIIIFLLNDCDLQSKFVVYTNVCDAIDIDTSIKTQCKICFISNDVGYNDYHEKKSIDSQNTIYFTEAFNALAYTKYLRGIPSDIPEDLSLAGRIVTANRKAKENGSEQNTDPIQTYLHWETEQQVRAYEAACLPFSPQYISIKPIVPDSIEYLFSMHTNNAVVQSFQPDMLDFYKQYIVDHRQPVEKGCLLLRAVIASLLQCIMFRFNVRNPKREEMQLCAQAVKQILDAWRNLWRPDKRSIQLAHIMKFIRCVYENPHIWSWEQIDIISHYEKALKFFFERQVKYSEYTLTFHMGLTKNSGRLMQWFLDYDASAYHGAWSYLSFEWGMSTGERAYFNLYANLYYAYQKMQNMPYEKDIILMIDEADLYLHPRWQQDGIKRILDIAVRCFPDRSVQIILATHSPLFLSDVPLQHVIFLSGNETASTRVEHKECFAANIYNLYKDTFFLDKSEIWVYGTFAQDFVHKIQDDLSIFEQDSSNITKDDLQFIKKRIFLIGEELLQAFLMERWKRVYEKFLKNERNGVSSKGNMILNEIKKLSKEERELIKKKIDIME